MSPDHFEVLARAIAEKQFIPEWHFYVLQLLIAVVAGAIGALGSAYLKRRGETLATKADLDELLKQLRETTRVAEEVKASVQAQYDETFGVRTTRRDRLEQMAHAVFELEQCLREIYKGAWQGKYDPVTPPESKIRVLQALYFPDLKLHTENLMAVALRDSIVFGEMAMATEEHATGEGTWDKVAEKRGEALDRSCVFREAMTDFISLLSDEAVKLRPKEAPSLPEAV